MEHTQTLDGQQAGVSIYTTEFNYTVVRVAAASQSRAFVTGIEAASEELSQAEQIGRYLLRFAQIHSAQQLLQLDIEEVWVATGIEPLARKDNVPDRNFPIPLSLQTWAKLRPLVTVERKVRL